MLSREENELLTRVGPGTPCGELLRRYWWPVAMSADIGKAPVKVRALGEDLILFRNGKGQVGLVDRQCCHRNASLEFGRVEEDGLRCCYHGWLYDPAGRVLDMPCEPPNSPLMSQILLKAYPVREISGFVFAYMGPQPVPSFPKYDLLFRDDCNKIVQGRDMNSNWLQRAENMLDALHVMVLHASVYPELAMVRPTELEWVETPHGVKMDLTYPNGVEDRHYYAFPFINRVQVTRAGQEPFQFMQWGLPVDDTKCISYQVWASEVQEGPFSIQTGKYQVKLPGDYRRVEDGWWNIWERDQDDAAMDSQGVIADRSREHLATCDRGIAMMRKMVRDSIDAVKRGEDPKGVIRDDNHALIDMYSYKTELGAVPGQVRNPELGQKLNIVAPFDL